MQSSPACWAAYGEVLAREYSDPALADVHLLSVDAYAVQHPGRPSRQSIHSVGLHLVRLLLQLEHGLAAAGARAAMVKLEGHKHVFSWLEPPAVPGALTVAAVAPRAEPEAHRRAVRAWARSGLDAWSMHRPTFERWAAIVAAP
jgi:hypothetical protein